MRKRLDGVSRGRAVNSLCAALLLLLVGCGTTVRGADGATAGDGLTGTGGGSVPPRAPGLDQGTSGGSPGALSGSTGGGSGAGTTGSGARPGAIAPGGTTGGSLSELSVPGVTATTIKVGLVYLKGSDEANRAAGVPVVRGDERKYWKTVVDEVNARGGIAGRRLVAVYYPLDAQSTQTIATQEQAACSAFTQDTRVFAVLSNGSADFEACIARVGVLHATPGGNVGFDREFHWRYPAYFTQRPTQDRMQADLVSALVRQAYFTGWDTLRGAPAAAGTKPKVGVLVVDRSYITRTVDRVLLPALRKAGHPVDSSSIYRAPATPSVQEAGAGSAAVQAAVLGFRQKGVTHVIVLDINGSTTLLFAQQSSNQAYYPRMGVTTASGIQALYDTKLVQARQLNGTMGLGWVPIGDLPAGQADRYLTKAAPECLNVMKRRGGLTFTNTVAASIALYSCDAVFTFATTLQRAGRELSLVSAVRAYESIGRGLVSASVGRLFFSPTHHDGLEIAYDWAWDANCPCMRYLDTGHRMP